jgi:hypothetical protein
MREGSINRYPLEWPLGWVRAKSRVPGNFKSGKERISLFKANQRLEDELERLGAKNLVLSTNVSLRMDGRPRSDERPKDPGAAVYFSFRGKATVLACDRYVDVAQNVAAIAAHVEALRGMDRWGVGTVEQALAGYKALPADTAADWRAVFGYKPGERTTVEDLKSRFKLMARDRHPDRLNDDGSAMAHLNRARDYAIAELGG